ncbi:hypothetical protein [Viridibacillus arvi]|uniref:hypothetical protein n=1 Tax=Viridibacillus arvi TaxID=263475 RepID=UPI003D2E757D
MRGEFSSRESGISTNNLLEAVKITLNYEVDLYSDRRSLVSWLGYDMEENICKLDEGRKVLIT